MKELRRNTLPAPADGSGSPFTSASARPFDRGAGRGTGGTGGTGGSAGVGAAGGALRGGAARRLGSRRLKVTKQSMRRAEAPQITLESTALPTPPATPEASAAPARGFPGFELTGTEWPATPTATGEEEHFGADGAPQPTLSCALDALVSDDNDDDDDDDDDDGDDDGDDNAADDCGEEEQGENGDDETDFDPSDLENDDYDDLNDSEIEV